MPTITPSNALSGALRGMGMQLKFDEETLRKLRGVLPNDTLQLDYKVDVGGGEAKATLAIGLNDPNDLFAGYTVTDVLANLLTQMVAARLL